MPYVELNLIFPRIKASCVPEVFIRDSEYSNHNVNS